MRLDRRGPGVAFTAGKPIEIWLPERRVRAGIVVRCGALPACDIIATESLPLTTGVRTGVDLARYVPGDDAVAALDQCVRADRYGRSMTTVPEIVEYLGGHSRLHRSRRIAEVLREVDGRAESPQETHTRLMLHRAGLGMFVPQIRVDGGRYRLDLGAEEFKVAVEYDGRDHSDPGQQALDVNRRNTLRHDFGWEVLPITKDILQSDRVDFLRQVRSALVKRGWRP